MITKLGVCISDLGPCQIAYTFLKNANDLLAKRQDVSIYGFYDNLSKSVIGPMFGIFSLGEVYGFDGTLITTSAILTHQIMKFPKPKRRIFYVNSIEWGDAPYEFYESIFRSGVELVARCPDYAKLVENAFNVPCGVNEDFDLEKFL